MCVTVSQVTLLERDGELAGIQAALDEGGLVIVEGGAGIGKTSLLAASATRASMAGGDILRARSSELEQGFTLGIVRQLFERRIARADEDERSGLFSGPASAALSLFSGELAVTTGDDLTFAILHGLYWLAANLATRQPVILVVDDVQWADGPSLRWLAFLAPRLEGLGLSVILGLRPTDRTSSDPAFFALRSGATIVRPGLLSRDAVAIAVRDSLAAEADEELCATVWRESGGNPFYMHELIRLLLIKGAGDAGASALVLTSAGHGVVEHVTARVRALDHSALRIAQVLAVLGEGCELRHAAVLAGVEIEAAARLGAGLVQLEVLATDSPPRFLHPIVQQAVEASLDRSQVDAHHRAAARLLYDDGAPPGIVAAHLMRTRPAGNGWVLARLREAASAAVDSGAPLAATELLGRALSEPPSAQERADVLREAGRAEILVGRESGCTRLEEALKLVADARLRAAIGLELAEGYGSLFRWVEAVDVCERALVDLGDADSDLAARLAATLAVCGLRDSRRALAALPVVARLGQRPLDGPAAEEYAVARALQALWFDGRPAAEVVALLEPAFEQASPLPANWDLRAPGIWALIVAEGFAEAEATLERMRAGVERVGSARGIFVTYAILGLLRLRLGALPEADASARVALRVLEAADMAPGLPLGLHVLAYVAIEAGDLDEAEALLSKLPHHDQPPGLGTVHIAPVRGRLRLAQGRPREALAEFEQGRSQFSAGAWGIPMYDNGFLHARSSMALALLQLGQRERAVDLAQEELRAARAFGGRRALGIGLRIAGLATGGEPGLDLLRESVAALRDSPAVLERAHSLVELGAAMRRAARRIEAREPLAEALDLAARCAARPLAARARDELKAAGARPRREWRVGVEALTPSELRVARLAAEGRTNREIAQAIYITLKTVEGHLARVYGKLEIDGRDGLRQTLEGDMISASHL
jgi:DNA-binding NarL/FixJ family response regulator